LEIDRTVEVAATGIARIPQAEAHSFLIASTATALL
jgi:hypothetical protein